MSAIATMQFEAMCYSLSQSDDNFAPLALLMPKFYAYDPGRYVLIVELLVDVYQAVKDNLKPETPLFTKRLAAGLGFAEDPGNGESFGMSRCRIVAEGLWSAYVKGLPTQQARLQEVIAHFEKNGIALEHPYLNARSIDHYEFTSL